MDFYVFWMKMIVEAEVELVWWMRDGGGRVVEVNK